MRESSKTNQYRDAAFFERYLSGKVLDIGCGDDPIVPHAQPFDRIHGDAERILNYFPAQSFDTVCSSHCLEHMSNVPKILSDWWELVKPGGHMLLVVPHEDLYEQGFWPSLFNRDHKATFRLGKQKSWSPVSYELNDLLLKLKDSEIQEIAVQDIGLNYAWLPKAAEHQKTLGTFKRFLSRLRHSLIKRLNKNAEGQATNDPRIDQLNKLMAYFGIPTDQTHFGALAQFQCIIRRKSC